MSVSFSHDHVGISVTAEDLDAAISQLGDQDVELIGGPVEIAEIGQRIAFITDNLGNIIELAEPGTWPAGRRK